MNLGDSIHAALKAAFAAGTFAPISYPAGVRTTGMGSTQPATLLIKPVDSEFGLPRRNRQHAFRERLIWSWLVTAEWSREVSVEEFEFAVTQAPPRVLRTATQPQADLFLELAEYEHPPEQQAGGGTRARYRFRAELSPL